MLSKLLGTLAAGTVAVGLASSAHAIAILSFNVTGIGNYTVDTGDITAATAHKTIPGAEFAGGTTTPGTFAAAGLFAGAPVTFSTLTLNTTNGPFAFTLTAGFITATFTLVSQADIAPTGFDTAGHTSQQYNGTITGDTSVGQIFLGQTASLSETCTQTSTGAAISCSESFITPGLPITTPEPITLAILGGGLVGMGVVRRRRD